MRVSCALALLLCLMAGTPVLAVPQTCGPQALGVGRTLEIDTRAGPRFGFQYQDPGLLADGEVILTFDDGPLRAYTRPILETLAAHCTKATFFLVGRMAVADPEMVRICPPRPHGRHPHLVARQPAGHVTGAGAGGNRAGLQRRAGRDGSADRAVLSLSLSA